MSGAKEYWIVMMVNDAVAVDSSDAPIGFLPVFDTYDKARAAYPKAKIVPCRSKPTEVDSEKVRDRESDSDDSG